MKSIAVFVSGNGTNLQAIIDAIRRKTLVADLKLVVCDQKEAFALRRAEKAGVPVLLVDRQRFSGRLDFEKVILRRLRQDKINFVVLAGFMRILSPSFVKAYRRKILNIHPALLPAFPGVDAIRQAFSHGVKVTGVTVHFVDEKVDHGPVIAQEPVRILDSDTIRTIEKRVHRVEHKLYPRTIQKVLSGC